MSKRMESYMAKPEILESKPAVTEAAIVRLEKRLKSKLPLPYREFLLRHNGGRPQPATFVPSDKDRPTEVINSFLALDGDPDVDDLSTFLKLYKKRLPASFLPVAYDAFGNLICIGLQGPGRGRVYFWNHESERKDDRLIADDWDSFLESFQTPESKAGD
jgi:cell wall assembly regulator SMI1